MVKDKINYRARGPNTALTRQSVQGRANDGGLRIGEMERDGVLAHGMSYFLNESFLIRGDEYFMAVCNKTGAIAIYNEAKNLFISPYADGPVNFSTNPDGTMNLKCITRFGRSFSIVRVPYALKLLMQELMGMNVQMRIITEDNIDQLMSMSFSDNIGQLLNQKAETNEELKQALNQYSSDIRVTLSKETVINQVILEAPEIPEPAVVEETPDENAVSSAYSPEETVTNSVSPAYIPSEEGQSSESQPSVVSSILNGIQTIASTLVPKSPSSPNNPSNILEVEEAKEEKSGTTESSSGEEESNQGERKIIIQNPEESSSSNSNSGETRKISL